jgi:excisionase family DNA binding protein
MAEDLRDIAGAAARLCTTERHVRELIYRRELPFVKVGRLVRFRDCDLDMYIEGRTIKPQRAS